MPTTTAAEPPGLALGFLPFVDMTTLSQSELRALSLCSSSSFDPRRTDDVVTPVIDRSSFNESAGSRRQTYSRLSSHHHHHRHRLAGVLSKTPNPPSSSPPFNNPTTDSDYLENHSIISYLKQFLSTHPEFEQLDLVDFDTFSHLNEAINFTSHQLSLGAAVEAPVVNGNFKIGERKRKRGRKPKVKVLNAEERRKAMSVEILNKNGVAVDLVRLAGMEDPYREELSRRTQGMDKEEELLGFFRDLEGQWCSRRRKRKIVDASEFGDTLPVGWKLLLGLKRKEGRAWVYCRRYLSPGGQHFVSCKEVSAYLQSCFGSCDTQQVTHNAGGNIQQVHIVASDSYAGTTGKAEGQRQSSEREKAVALLGIDNMELAEVQIHDLFECHKCNMTFDDRDTYLQHLLSFHQRTTRRYRLGSSVGDGVIVKDGKYECQFCHKVFHERRRYNGHVGIHVRNYVRGIEESPLDRMALQKRNESPNKDELPAKISKMDALIEIAQNSIRETESPVPNYEPNGGFTSNQQNLAPSEELLASVSDSELKSDSSLSELDLEYGMIDKSQELELQKSDHVIDRRMGIIDDATNILDVEVDSSFANEQCGNTSKALGATDCLAVCADEMEKSVIEQERGTDCHSLSPLSSQKTCSIDNNMNLVNTDKQDHSKTDKVDKTKSAEIDIGFGSKNSAADNNIVQDAVHQPFEEDGLQRGSPEPVVSGLQPCHGFSAPNVNLDKVENEFCSVNQREDKITGFEELRLEDIEQLKFSFGTGQEPLSLPEGTINMENNPEVEGAYDTSVQFESEVVDTTDAQQFTTVCVWCGVEFSHEAVDTEMQSDSVGYMCPTCKARISGQLDVLGGGLS
ncbi:hypothetical protein JCGZ_24907 [Jatropha curcas]|uniref:C2H2-type domain-containing protein n=1 Tax=Jatropha curcas TaxID=180498 RepID=A0A067L0Z5_JATCU|nr:uncharacterized protein LOC105631583 isoform X2 [Jatropha curcas]KDP40908.1 hypothetical protein JCGZ_24907 [Jatropha curcas]